MTNYLFNLVNIMAKIKAVSNSVAASVETTDAGVGVLNLYTLPLETFTVNFANTVKGDKPKVILELAVPVKGIGTIQVFAPSYLSFDEQRAYLAEYFEHGMTVKGADNQPTIGADGVVDGIFFKRYEVDGPNYELVSAKAAISKMEATGLNSNVMTFGAANAKLSREQVQTATNLQRGNWSREVAKSEQRTNNFLGSIANSVSNVFK